MSNGIKTEKDYSVKISTLALIIVSAIFGAITTYIANNQVKGEVIHFSTIELISFVVTLLLSSASLVLAVMAINLGKSSEKLMLQRNDETFKLQNEVFTKTIEALSRIESSTGVTEKRIEDIISGRAGDLAERLVNDKIVTLQDKEALQEEIKNSLSKELSSAERKIQEEKDHQRRKSINEATERYNNFKDQLLLALSNNDNTKTLKIGEGKFRGEKEEIVDGLFAINGNKIGICTFSGEAILSDRFIQSLNPFINRLATEIASKTFNKVFLVFDSETETTKKYEVELLKLTSVMKEEITNNIQMVVGNNPDVIIASITNN